MTEGRTIFDMGWLAPTTKFDVLCGHEDLLAELDKAFPPEPIGRTIGDFRVIGANWLPPNIAYLVNSSGFKLKRVPIPVKYDPAPELDRWRAASRLAFGMKVQCRQLAMTVVAYDTGLCLRVEPKPWYIRLWNWAKRTHRMLIRETRKLLDD